MRKLRLPAVDPRRWPVRWRIATVSSALTFVILVIFAVVVGRLAADRLEDDFTNDLELNASELASSITVDPDTQQVDLREVVDRFRSNPNVTIAVVNAAGIGPVENPPPGGLPPPEVGIQRVGDLELATRQVNAQTFGAASLAIGPVFVQYGRNPSELDETIGRLWLFLAVGVGGATILSLLAGLAVADRAMRPIAALTATARKIAATRDPSLSMPSQEADDEVAELAQTLDSMLGELDAARAESQQMVQVQREFVADASHELRTPLTSILANLELLEDRLGSDGEDAEMVASALRSSRRMRRLVGDLLMLARADAGRVGERSRQDLAEIAAAAVAEVRPVADGHTIELEAAEAVPVVANADELHRLIVNLLDNGTSHTPAGSTIRVSAFSRDGQAVVQVADDGPGLPEGMADQIFSRFVRGGSPADVSADSGTVLGLAIVRAVAESHGGEVEAGASDAGGARFTVRLPRAGESGGTA